MTDTLAVAIGTLILAIASAIKQSIQHNDNKTQIAALKAVACIKAPTCPDFKAFVDTTIQN